MTRHQNSKLPSKTIQYLFFSSIPLTLLLLFLLVCPLSIPNSSALSSLSTTSVTNISTVVAPFISMSASPSVTIEAHDDGAISTSTANLSVTTNSREGFSLYLSTTGPDNSLHAQNQNNSHVIAPVPASTAEAAFPANTWGYRLGDDSLYNPIPAALNESDPVASTTEGNNTTNYNLTLATKIDATLPTDTYYNFILISAIANPVAAISLNELTYMQDMTSAICSNTMNYENVNNYIEKSLIDLRDGRSCYVAKLADGNCWMTQNLALDLSTDKTLTNADTDLNSVASWTPALNTSNSIPAATPSPSYIIPYSWNLGQYVLATSEITTTDCGTLAGSQNLSQCPNLFQDVSDWLPTWPAQEGAWGSYTGFVAANEAGKTDESKREYDPHYLIGNYYSWNAATAGSGEKTDALNSGNTAGLTNPANLTDATDSICPKNWQLPKAGCYKNPYGTAGWPFDREDSFYRLLRAYDYPVTGSTTENSSLAITNWVVPNASNNAYTTITGQNKVRLDGPPMYFTRSGEINMSYGRLQNPGSYSLTWSSTPYANNTVSSFSMLFDQSYVYPSYDFTRDYGHSVRCLAR